MGITGLIPFMEKASSRVHLKDIRGSTVAVDTYCWLHKGVFSCAEKLARGEDTNMYILYCLKYVDLLLSYDIKPILVFDGRHLPAKALTERRRRESRQQSKKRAAELLRLGRTEEARSHMRRAVDVTHEMALKLIRECRLRNVDCIVAPYEADAQMAWLNKVDLAQYIITEDSDLTLFGARKVIFKLDLAGAGLLVEAEKLHLAMGCPPHKYSFDKFRRMCILSGCDYLDSLPGIGLAKACKFVLKTEEDDMWRALKKIPQYLNMRQLEVDEEYIENFLKADATFKHMFIYNPRERRMERLYDLKDYETEERYCSNAGTLMEDSDQAFQLALGNVNPFTLKQLDNWHPDHQTPFTEANPKITKRAKHKSIWQSNFQPHAVLEKATKKPVSCALYFKKVDFIGKTINEEIQASIKAENAKPEEAEVFSMYQSKAAEYLEPSTKRKRYDSSSSSSSVGGDAAPELPTPTKVSHNPFVKVHHNNNTIEETLQKSPAICENSSLLRVCSPTKCQAEVTRHSMRLTSLKRSIFDKSEAPRQVEVKSRFFAANVKRAAKLQRSPAIELIEEMNKIEDDSERIQRNHEQLYDSPLRRKEAKKEELTPTHADSGIESMATDNCIDDDSEEVPSTSQQSTTADSETTDSFKGEETNEINTDEAITISDDDSITSFPSTAIRPKPIGAFKPRLGLTKPKTKSTKSSRGSSKLSKAASTTTLAKNQTSLSMFGFQKRPSLK